MKVLLLVVLCLLAINIVCAAEYNIVYYEEYEDDYLTGNVKLGRIILTKEIINGINHNYTINNTVNTLTMGDGICNKDLNSLNIIGEKLLLTNECYNNFQLGEYVLQYIGLNITNTMNVIEPVNPHVNFTAMYSPFPLTFSKNNFVFDTDEEEIIINITLPTFLLPATYHIMYDCGNDGLFKNINVIENIEWYMNVQNVSNSTLFIGTVGNVTSITINNVGNAHTKLDVNFIGNGASFLNAPDEFISYPNNNITFIVTYDVNNELEAKDYDVTIEIKDENENIKSYDFSFLVKDTVFPIIEYTSINGSLEATKPFKYILKVTDNAQIDHCTVDVFYGNTNVYSNIQNGTSADENFVFEIMLNNLNVHHFSVVCYDIYFNQVKKEEEFVVEKLNSLSYKKTISFKKYKIDTFGNSSFINVTFPSDITIQLIDFVYDGYDYTFKITNQKNIFLIKNINTSINIKDAHGLITLEFKGDTTGNYKGEFQINGIINAINYDNIFFSGEMIDYKIPDAFKEDWFDGFISCEYENVDVYEQSTTKCEIVKSGLIDRNDIGIPITLEDKDKLHASYQETIDQLKKRNATKLLWNVVFIVVLGVLVFYIVMIVKVQPHFRWRLYK